MRLAFVSVSDQLGGSEAVLLQLVSELGHSRPSWEIDLIVPGDGPLGARALAAGARVHVVPMPPALARIGEWASSGRIVTVAAQMVSALRGLPGYERRFAAALRAIAPRVIHSNGFKAHVVSARANVHASRLWHVHEYVSSRAVTRRLLRRYAPLCDLAVANSASVARDLEACAGDRLRQPVKVIHNGVDLDRFTPVGPVVDLDDACGLPAASPTTIRVGLVATFSRWKGHEVFLRALATLSRNPAVRGYVVGGSVYDTTGSQYSLEELRVLASSLGLGTRVGFTGFQTETPAVMRALDVVVHASTEPEPFGLVIAEAMACGRAVISSGTGGSAEIIGPGVTALMHPPGDADALARTITMLAGDRVLRARLGAAAREAAEARFGARQFGASFVSAYESL
ncbi:MAG TPA: glycosyltransferase [Vicinamibacterales bacterium]|nr:glycosyltransferase [Vicinamibacterales bacterium]